MKVNMKINKNYVSVVEFQNGIICGNKKMFGIGYDRLTNDPEFISIAK
jgi:hypothetical protein